VRRTEDDGAHPAHAEDGEGGEELRANVLSARGEVSVSYSLTVLSDLSFSKGVAPEQVKQILLSVDGMREFGPESFSTRLC
jgi:hypothetical protein